MNTGLWQKTWFPYGKPGGKKFPKDFRIHWGNQKFEKHCWKTKFLTNFQPCHTSISERCNNFHLYWPDFANLCAICSGGSIPMNTKKQTVCKPIPNQTKTKTNIFLGCY